MQLFEYAVIKQEKLDKDGEIVEKAEVIINITPILAKDQKQAELMAARSIPATVTDDDLGRIQVAIRPF